MTTHRICSVPGTDGFEIQYYVRNEDSATAPQTFYPAHIHDYLEIYYLIDGDVSFMVDSRIYPLHPGDAVVCRPNEIHHCIRHSATPHLHACFWFLTDNEFLLGSFLHGEEGGNLLSPSSEEERAAILSTVMKLHTLPEANTLTEYSLIVSLLDRWNGCLGTRTESADLPVQLRQILEEIGRNLPEIRSLTYLTEKYYLTPSQLRRMFATYLGTTPKAYLERRRLAYSRILLKNGARVTDACNAAGFSDLSNYIRLFRTSFGITPSDYRRGITVPEPNKYI